MKKSIEPSFNSTCLPVVNIEEEHYANNIVNYQLKEGKSNSLNLKTTTMKTIHISTLPIGLILIALFSTCNKTSDPTPEVPTISAFTPTSTTLGATVTITGTNFLGATAVSFGGTAATTFNVASATSITAVVGAGASGNVSVTTPGGAASLAGFTFNLPIATPTIASFSPTTATSGATVTITGTNLTGATAVSFGGTAATSFNVASATSITAVVGAGASGNISVTTPGGTASQAGFTFNADPTLRLTVDFNAGTYTPLTYTTGRTDSPADADPAYSAIASGSQIVYNVPTSTLRPKLSGFLDLPQSATYAPISGNMIHEFTFTDVSQLNALGADANSLAIAACYIRGNYSAGNGRDWTTGDNFGGYWFGFVKNADGTKQTVIRSTNTNLVSETFSATTSVSYRVYKKGNVIELYRKYDAATTWTKVGETTITIRTGGSSDVYMTHVRVLNNSNAAVAVNADDFKWYY